MSLHCIKVTLGVLSETIPVGVTVEAENEPMTNTVTRFTRRINVLLSEMYLLTKPGNHISKMVQTLGAINVDSIWTFQRGRDGVLNHIWARAEMREEALRGLEIQ